MKEILLYNLNNAKGQHIRKMCSSLGIACRDVMPADYLQPIGAVAGLPGFHMLPMTVSAPAFAEEMMVFCGFTNDDIYALLTQWKAEGIPPIHLKAALTPHNAQWNSLQLHNELGKEHAAMNR